MKHSEIGLVATALVFVMFLAGFAALCKLNELVARNESLNYKAGMYRCEDLIDKATHIMTRRQQWKFHAIIEAAAKERE